MIRHLLKFFVNFSVLIYLSNIGDNADAIKKIYVDDTKVKRSIKKEEDVESLQNDWEKTYDLAQANNMVSMELNVK